ncbi:hypothetical protein [Geomonas sp.]|uniref:hypothetical protein n=1 Tax=Geomonas sp. TaxID=2651584 RepID=UPI002B49D491|nr:hypothetical protein [Geomonas sp.]HJV35540.1 hypothetical protein [Geomonas sp.]
MRPVPLLACLLVLAVCRPALAADKKVTFFLDGARLEEEVPAVKGYLEYWLPDSAVVSSLRVKPVATGKVLRVEVVPAERDRRRAREIAKLEERKSELKDRLETLSRQEEIFSAALKSQSGKAPRKSRTNPDPVQSLRDGTAFALGQLEAVYRGQRKCQRAIDDLDRKIAAARKGAALAKVWMTGTKVNVSCLIGDRRWSPGYDFRWSGDNGGELLLHARVPAPEKQVIYLVSNGTVSEDAPAVAVRGEYPVIARYPLTLQSGGRGKQRPISFTFKQIEASLPPGEASAFWEGEYLGSGKFSGGASSELSIGAP